MIKRNIDFIFKEPISQAWFKKSSFTKAFLYSYTLLVPDSERYILRSVIAIRKLLPKNLQKDTNLLFFQEGQHASEHDKANLWLEKQGFRIKLFRKICYLLTYAWLEKILSKTLNLSIASAF